MDTVVKSHDPTDRLEQLVEQLRVKLELAERAPSWAIISIVLLSLALSALLIFIVTAFATQRSRLRARAQKMIYNEALDTPHFDDESYESPELEHDGPASELHDSPKKNRKDREGRGRGRARPAKT